MIFEECLFRRWGRLVWKEGRTLPETAARETGRDGILRSDRAGHYKTAEDLTITSHVLCSHPGAATEPISRSVSSQKSLKSQQH